MYLASTDMGLNKYSLRPWSVQLLYVNNSSFDYEFDYVRLPNPIPQSNDWCAIGFYYPTFDWLRRA